MMVKADWSFDSAIIDPYGRIIERTLSPEGSQAILIANVPLGSGATVATRIGDLMGWLGCIGMICFSIVVPLSQRSVRLQASR